MEGIVFIILQMVFQNWEYHSKILQFMAKGDYRNTWHMEFFLLKGGNFRWRSKAARMDYRLFIL